MKNEKDSGQKLKFSTALFKGSFIYNPILTQVIGVCPIVGAATTLKNALVLSLVLSLALIFCEVLSSLALKKVERNVRVCLYCLFASIPTLISSAFMSDKTLSALGIFLPLLSVNAIIVIRCEKFAVKTSVRNSFLDSIASSLGFFAVAAVVGFLRELFACGSVFSLKLSPLPAFSAFALPFGGLVLLGFLAAAHKGIVMKYFPDELVDTFNFSKIFEKPALRDPGIGIGKKNNSKKEEAESDSSGDDLIRPRHSIEIENNDTAKSTKKGTESEK